MELINKNSLILEEEVFLTSGPVPGTSSEVEEVVCVRISILQAFQRAVMKKRVDQYQVQSKKFRKLIYY